jgi:hypothetical protein
MPGRKYGEAPSKKLMIKRGAGQFGEQNMFTVFLQSDFLLSVQWIYCV